ncbi:MAG: hypothetical protein JWO36_4743, partial [Myxococcales bacterium]|nr:hypothetical protein [Myxococcales bacterium]
TAVVAWTAMHGIVSLALVLASEFRAGTARERWTLLSSYFARCIRTVDTKT